MPDLRLACLLLIGCSALVDPTAPAWEPVADSSIPARWGHVAIYDQARDRMVVFGGDGHRQLNDLWALDLASHKWSQLPAFDGPSPRSDLGAIYDQVRDRLVIIGGRIGFAASTEETWAYSFATAKWSQLPSVPVARHDVPATTDGTRAWVFGGAGKFLQSLDDLWELDLATNTWRELPDGGKRPKARTSGALVYLDGALYIAGGHDAVSVQRDSWRYNLSAQRWEKLEREGDPAGGAHFGYTADTTCGTIIVSAGDNLDNYNVAFTSALTVRGPARFSLMQASTMPPPRDHPSMILDQTRRRLILFGGGSIGDGLAVRNDTWQFPLRSCP